MTPTTWNPADNSTLTLWNGNFTAGGAPSAFGAALQGWLSVRATTSHTSGLWYFRIRANCFGANGDFMIGVANANAPLNNYIGASSNGIGSQYGGALGARQIYLGGGVVGHVPALGVEGDYAVIAINLNSNLYWSTVQNSGVLGSWNSGSGTPAAGTQPWARLTPQRL